MVALGQRLRGAGHDVVLATGESFRALVTGAGLEFVPAGRDVESEVRARGEAVMNPLGLFSITQALVDEQFAALDHVCDNADILVGSLLLVAGPSLAEAKRLPLCMVSYFPGGLPSRDIPAPMVSQASGPPWLNRATWALQGALANAAMRGPLNRQRDARGLPPVLDVTSHTVSHGVTVLATDMELGPPPSEWKGRVHTTGFWFLDSPEPLSKDLLAFLAAGEPPIYIGFGSMPNDDAAQRMEIIREACTTVSCRAVVSAGWAGLGSSVAHPRVKTVGAVNHQRLFERVSAVVHHAGAGTTAAAARAGVPQVVVPHFFDQFYWASRVHALGLGPAPLDKDLKASALVTALRAALEDAAMKERARVMGLRLSRYSGADRAVTLLEQVVAGIVY
jgi:UDP:flavonoid glycosyltransferase YjiC (YdhE family)